MGGVLPTCGGVNQRNGNFGTQIPLFAALTPQQFPFGKSAPALMTRIGQ